MEIMAHPVVDHNIWVSSEIFSSCGWNIIEVDGLMLLIINRFAHLKCSITLEYEWSFCPWNHNNCTLKVTARYYNRFNEGLLHSANISLTRVLHTTYLDPAATVQALFRNPMCTDVATSIQNSSFFATNSSKINRHVYTTRGSRTLTRRHGNW